MDSSLVSVWDQKGCMGIESEQPKIEFSEYDRVVTARRAELSSSEWQWLQNTWHLERRSGIAEVEKRCPFSELVCSQIGELPQPKTIPRSANFLAWMLMRDRNPFFVQGTGWEGYAIAHTVQPAHVLQWELQLGKSLIDRLYAAYPPGSVRQDYVRFVEGRLSIQNLRYWNASFGAELGRQRISTLQHPLARAYRLQTYQQLPPVSEVVVATQSGVSIEQYRLPCVSLPETNRIDLSREYAYMTELEQVALRLLCQLGMLGHPAVRLAQRTLYAAQYLESCIIEQKS